MVKLDNHLLLILDTIIDKSIPNINSLIYSVDFVHNTFGFCSEYRSIK